MSIEDNNFGGDEYHGDDGTGVFSEIIKGKDSSRQSQRQSNAQDYSNMFGHAKPVLTYPQDLFQANQVNGVCFFVKVRKNSVAGQLQGSSSPDGKAADRIGAFQIGEELTQAVEAVNYNRPTCG